MAGIKGINTHKSDKTICLVAGCSRTALYRKPASNCGYCSHHRAGAVERSAVVSKDVSYLLSDVERSRRSEWGGGSDTRGPGWPYKRSHLKAKASP